MKNTTISGRDFTDEEICGFVGDLESLPGGELTVSLLVGCGERAIAPLREFLLRGQPRGIFQPRQRAVEALAQLGAKEVLLEYLSREQDIPDAVARFGEEAAENTAARELSRWRTEEVYQFVLHLARRRMRVGLIETLGDFERPESADILLRALEDDVCRPAAEVALSRIAAQVKSVLLQAAGSYTADGEGSPSELQRRRSVLRTLSELSLTASDWSVLRPLLRDQDQEIALLAASMGVECAPVEEKTEAARFLIRRIDRAPWFVQIRIQDCLRKNYDKVKDVIVEQLVLRRRLVHGEPLVNQVVRVLTGIQSSQEQADSQEEGGHGKREHRTD
jgi:hypothetical protein